MAPNKKKGGGRSNNKNGKGKGGVGGSKVAVTTPTSSLCLSNNDMNSPGPISESVLQNLTWNKSLPTFHHDGHSNEENGTVSGTGGYYEIYKHATTRFRNWMKGSLPPPFNSSNKMTSVNDLRKGADQILHHNVACLDKQPPPLPIKVPKQVLDDLYTSIYYREKFAVIQFGGLDGGDSTHKYMVDVLAHCRAVLGFTRQVAKVASVNGSNCNLDNAARASSAVDSDHYKVDDDIDQIGGRFHALVVDDDDDDDENENENEEDNDESRQTRANIRERNFPSFTPPTSPDQEIDIQTVLIEGDDRFQAIALLQTMDDLMGAVESHYGLLKRYLRGQDLHDGNSVQLLMECAVAANMATETVRSAENALMTKHPHIASFYHILALIYLPNYIADIKRKIHPSRLERDPHMVLHFVAGIVDCCFHNRGEDRLLPGIVQNFVKKSGLSPMVVEMEKKQIFMLTYFEVQLAMEEKHNAAMKQMMAGAGLHTHSWLEKSFFHIGGDRCILNTQKIVQMLMDIVQYKVKLIGKPGFWGLEFDEDRQPAMRLRGDLDETFAGRIMPELLGICWNAPFQCLPEKRQLITLLDLLQEHVKGDRTRPVPMALTFALHALLISIFVMQGDGDLARIASYSKQSYNALFAQLDDISQTSKLPHNAPNFYINTGLFKNLVNFAKPVSAQDAINKWHVQQLDFLDPTTSERLAFWNPLVGGDYLLYGTYMCSVGLGSATVDSLGQTRFTLHLYNALRQRDPTLSSIGLLQTLDKAFARTKAIWVGGRPEKGSYCKHFWLAWGMSISEATRNAAVGSGDTAQDFASLLKNEGQFASSDLTRKLNEILPEEFSASYKRLVKQDFTDTTNVAGYSVTNAQDVIQEKKQQFEVLATLVTRINMTRDSMDEDEDILQMNFSAIGSILLEFTNALSEHMGWDSIINLALQSCPEVMRTGKTVGGKRMKPGSFHTSDLNCRRQAMAHMWAALLSHLDASAPDDRSISIADKAALFMTTFFRDVPSERYLFLVEKEEVRTSLRRNPLEGNYPYGRTGKTTRDPLQGFFHFKYSKRGKPVARSIKPGKCTPFNLNSNGDTQTPYTETGSKVIPQPSGGKCRHIASYSLDELIDLGWDGAMYGSSKGQHSARGQYVPFIVGYDSDEDDIYEPIDIQAGKRAGTIGLPTDEIGLYMTIPDMNGGSTLVRLQKGRS